jgi:hypothetical protein
MYLGYLGSHNNDYNLGQAGITLSYSPRPHLQQRRNIYFFLIPSQCCFFTLRAEHGHAVGEFVPFGADVQ